MVVPSRGAASRMWMSGAEVFDELCGIGGDDRAAAVLFAGNVVSAFGEWASMFDQRKQRLPGFLDHDVVRGVLEPDQRFRRRLQSLEPFSGRARRQVEIVAATEQDHRASEAVHGAEIVPKTPASSLSSENAFAVQTCLTSSSEYSGDSRIAAASAAPPVLRP